jgi:hypothetical protein
VRRLELRGGVHAEVVGEHPPGGLVRGEGLGLPAGAGEGAQQQCPEALAPRVLLDERLELRHHLDVPAQPQVGLDPIVQAGQPQLLPPRHVPGRVARGRDVGQRRPAPQLQRLGEQARGRVGPAVGQGPVALGGEPLEPDGVEGLRRGEVEPVPGRARLDGGAVREHPAQPRDQRLDGVHRVRGQLVAPERVGQGADAHRAPGVDGEADQQRAQPLAADLDRPAAVLDQQWPEDRDTHRNSVSAVPAASAAPGCDGVPDPPDMPR